MKFYFLISIRVYPKTINIIYKMSKSNSNNNKSAFYCKVCHDSGKPESEYRSHSTRETRDPNSRVTCPVLLAIECRFCHGAGHTVKYCSVLKNKKREDERASKKAILIPKTATIPNAKVANMFDCLLEEEKVVLVEEEEKEFLFTTIVSPPISQLNYAVALAKPVPITRQISSMPIAAAATNKKSWAMMNMESDSDDEEVQEDW